MKNLLFIPLCAVALLAAPISSFAQASGGLTNPTREQLESTIGGMGLSMGEKLSLRSILQDMQAKGEKVRANSSLSEAQQTAQIIKVRQGALAKSAKILNADQQKKLAALLLPKQ